MLYQHCRSLTQTGYELTIYGFLQNTTCSQCFSNLGLFEDTLIRARLSLHNSPQKFSNVSAYTPLLAGAPLSAFVYCFVTLFLAEVRHSLRMFLCCVSFAVPFLLPRGTRNDTLSSDRCTRAQASNKSATTRTT